MNAVSSLNQMKTNLVYCFQKYSTFTYMIKEKNKKNIINNKKNIIVDINFEFHFFWVVSFSHYNNIIYQIRIQRIVKLKDLLLCEVTHWGTFQKINENEKSYNI